MRCCKPREVGDTERAAGVSPDELMTVGIDAVRTYLQSTNSQVKVVHVSFVSFGRYKQRDEILLREVFASRRPRIEVYSGRVVLWRETQLSIHRM